MASAAFFPCASYQNFPAQVSNCFYHRGNLSGHMCERALNFFAGRRRRRRRSAYVYANAQGVALIHSGKTRALPIAAR